MSLPDSFYLALCMTVLLVGAVYWVWTQIQFVQRKVNVLENIVYELKTLCSKQNPTPAPEPILHSITYPPAPSSVLGEDEDLLHETLQKEVEDDGIQFEMLDANLDADLDTNIIPESKESFHPEQKEEIQPFSFSETETKEEESDLQPGGIGSGVSEESLSNVLDGLSVKELRRLAEQKGISGLKEKKRKELIEAIRAAPVSSFFG